MVNKHSDSCDDDGAENSGPILGEHEARYIVMESKWDELVSFVGISDRGAELIAQHSGDHEMLLANVTELSPSAARTLATCRNQLSLDGLQSLAPETAEALSIRVCVLTMDGLDTISLAAASALAKSPGWLSLNGVSEITETVASALAAHVGDLELGGLQRLSVETARALAKHKGKLHLPASAAAALEAVGMSPASLKVLGE